MVEAPRILLEHHLKRLKLPTFLREYEKLARQHSVALAASAISAAVVVAVLWSAVSHVWLLVWLGLVCGVTAGRYLLMWPHRERSTNVDGGNKWALTFTLGTAASGVLWGVAGILFFVPAMPVFQVFLAFVIGGLCAGAAVAHAAHPPAFLSFLLPSLSPLVLRLLFEGEKIQVSMALMLTVFSAAMVLIARNLHRSTVEILRSQSEANRPARAREAELAHVGRLSTMGELASTLAHELNQPPAIVNYSRSCLRCVRASESAIAAELVEPLEQISAQANRASDMIEHIGSFVKKSEKRSARVDINEVIRGVGPLVGLELDRHPIATRYQLADGLPYVDVDIIGIEQVILNLVRNAIESCEGERSAVIAVESRLDANGSVIVGIADEGRGLPDGDSARIFEPFFTTKDKGMGMGLSISRSIVEAHGGKLWADAKPDRGTTFFFSLPAI